MQEGGIIGCERARAPMPALHPAARAGLVEPARRIEPASCAGHSNRTVLPLPLRPGPSRSVRSQTTRRHFIHPDDHHLFEQYLEIIKAGGQFRCRARNIPNGRIGFSGGGGRQKPSRITAGCTPWASCATLPTRSPLSTCWSSVSRSARASSRRCIAPMKRCTAHSDWTTSSRRWLTLPSIYSLLTRPPYRLGRG